MEQNDAPTVDRPEDQQEVTCPACGRTLLAYVRYVGVVVPFHHQPGTRPRPGDDTGCWVTGIRLAEAEAMVAMQQEHGGRLLRAAHP
jgi:hypothetical protein